MNLRVLFISDALGISVEEAQTMIHEYEVVLVVSPYENVRLSEAFCLAGRGFAWIGDTNISFLLFHPITREAITDARMSVTLVDPTSTPQKIVLFGVFSFHRARGYYVYEIPQLTTGKYDGHDVYIDLSDGQQIVFTIPSAH